jgi:hypothetical protein
MNLTTGALSSREAQEKSLLDSTAQSLRKKLSRRLKDSPVDFSGKLEVIKEPDVDGWYVKLATIKGADQIFLKIAIDDFTSSSQKRFWFGFSASKARSLRPMEDKCPGKWRQLKNRITEAKVSKVSKSGPSKWRLKTDLPKENLGRPVFEVYLQDDPKEFYWGIYVEKSNDLVRTAPSFFTEMSKLLFRIENKEQKLLISKLFNEDEVGNTTPAIIKRIRKIRKRNAAAARRLKELYAGRCQISGEQYVFPDKYGKPYTEAHHLVHLGEKGDDNVRNLIVVSAHIHRMLHFADVGQIDLSNMRNNKRLIRKSSG